ncbi:hypothetical protein CBI38_14475 [Rhodococcus oxybenzonivorans]|uniref:Uncharacterized protein n=1 Tax=Rhodococcus oxybenzonivorans TaxID=1990687 RepID=A0A2S2BVE2_9NOCA|nr:hypothetical protein CBI38_14475 [Rhodococcus oxybenzonivorans]
MASTVRCRTVSGGVSGALNAAPVEFVPAGDVALPAFVAAAVFVVAICPCLYSSGRRLRAT